MKNCNSYYKNKTGGYMISETRYLVLKKEEFH